MIKPPGSALTRAAVVFARPMAVLIVLLPIVAARADVIYLTDLEGSRTKLESFYQRSGAFRRDDHGWHLRDNFRFVYGGDVPDRFLGTRWITSELNRHFEENPGRMFALAGNRDVKALRFRVELGPAALRRPPHWTYWIPDADWLGETDAEPDLLRRLHFMLNKTMGSPRAFELRRQELAAEGRSDVSDHAVAQDLIDDVAPGGPMLELLHRMDLSLRMGGTLFVHGGLTSQNRGFVPGHVRRYSNLDEWSHRLNAWYYRQLSVFDGAVNWDGQGPRPAEDLHEYPMPGIQQTTRPESVITGRDVDDHQNPRLPTRDVIEWLRQNGIHRLIVGHTPVGDRPVTVRTADGAFEMIWADTSYTADEANAGWVKLSGPDLEVAETFGQSFVDDQWVPVTSRTVIGEPSRIGARGAAGARMVGQDPEGRVVSTRMESFKIITHREAGSSLHEPTWESPRADAGDLGAGPIGFASAAFDPPTAADGEAIRAMIHALGLKKFFIVPRIFGPETYDAGVVERIDMLKLMFADLGDVVEIRGEPFQGLDRFVANLEAGTTGSVHPLTLPTGGPSSLHPAVQHLIETHGLYRAAADVGAAHADHDALYREFLFELRRRVPAVRLVDTAPPPFRPAQSRGAWLETFILWTINENGLDQPRASLLADTARAVFANLGWESKFPVVKLKSGVPSGRCLAYLTGAPAIRHR